MLKQLNFSVAHISVINDKIKPKFVLGILFSDLIDKYYGDKSTIWDQA